MNYYIADYLAS